MPCSQCQGIERMFNSNRAVRELKKYRRSGPARTTRMLIGALKAEGVAGLTLLDIGGGVGALQHELLEAGVRNATGVDASTAYLDVARQEVERRGHADRVRHRHGDFVALAPQIEAAGVVTLDRVICCYPDVQALVGLSAARARRLYGVVYPRRTWWTRLGFRLINVVCRITGDPFRVFVHDPAAVEALVRDAGLARRFYQKTMLWLVEVYAHPNGASPTPPGV